MGSPSQGLHSEWDSDGYPSSLGGGLCKPREIGVLRSGCASEGCWSYSEGQAGFPWVTQRERCQGDHSIWDSLCLCLWFWHDTVLIAPPFSSRCLVWDDESCGHLLYSPSYEVGVLISTLKPLTSPAAKITLTLFKLLFLKLVGIWRLFVFIIPINPLWN